MDWSAFEDGATVGRSGSEGGVILGDEEYDGASRITLERDADNAPFAITCGVYGWFFHTHYLGARSVAEESFEAMKRGLAAIVGLIPLTSDPETETKMRAVGAAIEDFVGRFP